MLRRQVSRFAIVGGLATAVHLATAGFAHAVLGAGPLLANLLGYACAVVVSYLGNARWAFERGARDAAQFSRFIAVSLAGLLLNQAITQLTAHVLGLPFWVSLGLVVVTVPALTFLLSKLWVFKAADATSGDAQDR